MVFSNTKQCCRFLSFCIWYSIKLYNFVQQKIPLLWRNQLKIIYFLKFNMTLWHTNWATSVKPLPNTSFLQWPMGSSPEYLLKKDSTKIFKLCLCIWSSWYLPLVNSWFLSCMSHFSLPVPSSVFSCLIVPLQDQKKPAALQRSSTSAQVWLECLWLN